MLWSLQGRGVQSLGFRVQGVCLRVWDSRFKVWGRNRCIHSGCDPGFRCIHSGCDPGFRCIHSGCDPGFFAYPMPYGPWFRVSDCGFRAYPIP
jgi:hypothetical protein